MQKQKTIAKWLSVILLTTVAIGCYVALSSVDKTTTNTASGAEENQTLIQQPQITYSTLPRKGECVNSALVSHFGGSKDDYALDYAFFANKMLVFAKSESIDKDVEKQGLHIAVFCENVLEKSIFLGDENTEYICSSLTKNGILIFTKSDEEVRVILLKEDMSIGGKTSIKNCDKIVPISQGDDTLLLCLASNELYVCTIAKTLDVISDNFVYQTNGVTYVNCYAYADNLNVFIQDDVGIKILQYNVQSGFRVRYSLDKHSLLQVIPLVASNEQHFIVLSECDDVAYLNSFDASINHLAKQSIKNARHVVALADENGIKAVCDNTLINYCTHLDFISREDFQLPINNKDCTSFSPIDGAENLFVASTKSGFSIIQIESAPTVVFSADNAVANAVAFTNRYSDVSALNIIATCNNLNDFSYMTFGGKDVFYLSLTL